MRGGEPNNAIVLGNPDTMECLDLKKDNLLPLINGIRNLQITIKTLSTSNKFYMKISLIFPAYNEEQNIEESIISTIDFFKNNHINDWEVIVINDGSTDKTRLKVEKSLKMKNASG